MKLCCIFNYPPAYRTSIYKKIDDEFDATFYFADELEYGKVCDIKKIDYSIFKRKVGRIENRKIFKWGWKTGIQTLPFKDFDAFLITADADWSYVPFLITCKILNKPVYAWGHGPKFWCWKNFGVDRFFVRMLTKYFTYGEGGKRRLIELGVSPSKIEVIYNSLCESVQKDSRCECKSDEISQYFGNDFPTIMFVGRLTKVKKLDWLIDAIKIHNDKGIQYNLLIIGDGEERERLEEKTKLSSVSDRVWFYGECYDEDKLNALIYNSDLCVSPGNVGLTALHSMMYGTPVLSHDDFYKQMPEYETIVEGETGTLFHCGDFDDFCAKLAQWLSYDKDRESIRQNCYDMINGVWNSNYQISLLKKIII